MAEYIERRKAAEVLCNVICGSDRGLCISTPENCQQKKMLALYELAAADVAPVVRCKDCIWRGREECAMFYRCDCGEQHTWETDNDFCSYVERRDENA